MSVFLLTLTQPQEDLPHNGQLRHFVSDRETLPPGLLKASSLHTLPRNYTWKQYSLNSHIHKTLWVSVIHGKSPFMELISKTILNKESKSLTGHKMVEHGFLLSRKYTENTVVMTLCSVTKPVTGFVFPTPNRDSVYRKHPITFCWVSDEKLNF